MKQFIITYNVGSSNIKIAKYDAKTLKLQNKLKVETVKELLSWYKAQRNIAAVGHRIVHGGKQYSHPVIINKKVIDELKKLEALAPLHQPLALSILASIKKINPSIKQIACFDTAFHKGIPELEKMIPLPYSFFKRGICRYGFHGLSYEYIASVLSNIAGSKAQGRVLIAHLGNGSSICGMIALKSQAISMGFSALDGLMMGSRSGTIDPGVIIYLLKQKEFTIKQLEELLYHKSGLMGISNISNEVRVLEAKGGTEARRALKLYCYIAAKHIGSIAAAIRGFDCLVFTGGIGENSSYVRSEICAYLDWLGVKIDGKANDTNLEEISNNQSNIPVYVIPTDEELMMARGCAGLITPKFIS